MVPWCTPLSINEPSFIDQKKKKTLKRTNCHLVSRLSFGFFDNRFYLISISYYHVIWLTNLIFLLLLILEWWSIFLGHTNFVCLGSTKSVFIYFGYLKVVPHLVSPNVVSTGSGIANAYGATLSSFELFIIGFLLLIRVNKNVFNTWSCCSFHAMFFWNLWFAIHEFLRLRIMLLVCFE